ncbi:alpha/beta fold hydrolase [Psychrobacter lutiphocae]|uniref:alpha/beta fold hydrolase n=1 Tax=Psychrobacter lutiphocae TaxID=540500 RepID=UPI0003624F7B|nr:alpha/beta fold hydrolase [Psychrobacter lutiphocae]
MAFIQTKFHLIAYQDSGESYLPALFMAHPLGMSRDVWDKVCDLLHGHYRCIRWDLPGHGSSSSAVEGISIETITKDMLQIADALGIETFSFIGTSIGGVIGQELCQLAPERLEQVWLTNTGAVIGTKAAWDERAQSVRQQGLGKVAGGIVPRWFSSKSTEVNTELSKGWIIQLGRNDSDSYAKLCEALSEVDNTNKLKGFNRRITLIGGKDDVSTPPETLQALQAEFTNAKLIIVEDVGHVPSIEAPNQLVEIIQSNATRQQPGEIGVSYNDGLVTRKQILGSDHVEKSIQNATTLDFPFQQFITRNAWGELWGDGSLTVQQRSMITTGILAALGRDGELELHLRAAKRLGISEQQLRQVLMHVAIYAGVPASNHAFALAKKNGWGEALS